MLETITVVAEVQELKANPNRPAVGTIIEAELDRNKGVLATVLIANGAYAHLCVRTSRLVPCRMR